jgi:hypothetical protein
MKTNTTTKKNNEEILFSKVITSARKPVSHKKIYTIIL